jgi:hypothetical protein
MPSRCVSASLKLQGGCGGAHVTPPSTHTHTRVRTQVITPWDVSGGADGKVDYDKLIREVSGGEAGGCVSVPLTQAACAVKQCA